MHTNISDNGYFFNINRYCKASVGYPIELSKYPYDKRWNVVLSRPSWRQKHIHLLITQRQAKEGDIKEELIRINEIHKKMMALDKKNLLKKIYQKLKNVINRYRYQYNISDMRIIAKKH